jgi:asparagine synthase (glutamine-hydrolysing)
VNGLAPGTCHNEEAMCGLTGVFDPNQRLSLEGLKKIVSEMTAAIVHRGPDDAGVWVEPDGKLAFGHRRLSIIDLSDAGKQPMVSADGRWVIAYNGEMYNTAKIRELLGEVKYRGHSDTEVLVEAFSQWGVERTVREINAMFAFAAWDSQENELWLGRDRFGEKPLYYGWHESLLIFGSELKALVAVPGFHPEIDRQALGQLIQFSEIPAPDTIYRGIKKLAPGSLLRVAKADSSPEPLRFWDPATVANQTQVKQPRGDEMVDELEELLTSAVKARMESDVPLGAFLSGGIDSSTVVALMQKSSTQPVKTFTIGFSEDGYDESAYARSVAQHLHTDHTELKLSASDALAVIPKLPSIYDEPFADSSQIPTYLVSALAREHVTVALSGDGGDELFGGYDRYRVYARLQKLKGRVPGSILRSAGTVIDSLSSESWDKIGKSSLARFAPSAVRVRTGERVHKLAKLLKSRSDEALYAQLLTVNSPPESLVIGYVPRVKEQIDDTDRSSFEEAMLLDTCSYLPDDILVKVDRASMANSLEVRVPLLDPDVFSFAWGLHPDDRVRDGVGKWPLRQLLKRYVPTEMFERPKMGFGVPINLWLRNELQEWASQLLDDQLIREQGFFHAEPIRSMWAEHISGEVDRSTELWPVLMFQAWLQEWHKS